MNRGVRNSGLRGAFLAAALGAAALVPLPAAPHGGYPMSLAALKDPALGPLHRLVLVYLREGQGMTVEPLVAGTGGEIDEAYGEGRADLLIELPPEGWAGTGCGPGVGAAEKARRVEEYFRERRPGSWSRPFSFPLPPSPCPPVLLAHPRVTAGLRFGLLREVLERLVSSLDGDDYDRLLREGGGDPRGQNEAARRILREKGLL